MFTNYPGVNFIVRDALPETQKVYRPLLARLFTRPWKPFQRVIEIPDERAIKHNKNVIQVGPRTYSVTPKVWDQLKKESVLKDV